jgi:hypothetical protein
MNFKTQWDAPDNKNSPYRFSVFLVLYVASLSCETLNNFVSLGQLPHTMNNLVIILIKNWVGTPQPLSATSILLSEMALSSFRKIRGELEMQTKPVLQKHC